MDELMKLKLETNTEQLNTNKERGILLAQRIALLNESASKQSKVIEFPVIETQQISVEKKSKNHLSPNGYSYEQLAEFVIDILQTHQVLAEDDLQTNMLDKYGYDVKHFRAPMNILIKRGLLNFINVYKENNKRHYSLK